MGCFSTEPASRGFTLFEVLAAVAVLSVVAAIAIPAFSNWVPAYHLKAAAQDLYGSLQMAKAAAIEKGCNCSICFYQPVESITYDYVVFVDTDNDLEYDPGESILVKRLWGGDRFPGICFDPSKGHGKGVTFHHNDDGLPAISFQPSGVPISNTGGLGMGSAYLVNGKGKVARVVLSSEGNIRIE